MILEHVEKLLAEAIVLHNDHEADDRFEAGDGIFGVETSLRARQSFEHADILHDLARAIFHIRIDGIEVVNGLCRLTQRPAHITEGLGHLFGLSLVLII